MTSIESMKASEQSHPIDVWYGDTQYVGRTGTPQRWYNVLGRVRNAKLVEAMEAAGGKPRASAYQSGRRTAGILP
jgi:hypothetical protein